MPVNESLETYVASSIWGMPFPSTQPLTYASQIDDNLWMGSVPPYIGPPSVFRSILDMYVWENYKVPEGAVRRTYKMMDGRDVPDPEVLNDLADWVNERRKVGPVLVHCQAGLNRSGLITGLALIRAGLDPENAIKQIRERRSGYALSNQFFASYLRTVGEQA